MAFIKVGPRHQITIPLEVRESAGIDAGDLLEIVAHRGKVIITPKQVISKLVAVKLSKKEQETLLSARQKIKAIQENMIDSTGLTGVEADVAAKVGLIDPDQKYWWLEEWQEGEREVERDIKDGRTETFETSEEFLATLDEL